MRIVRGIWRVLVGVKDGLVLLLLLIFFGLIFAALLGVIIWSAFGVVHEAEELAGKTKQAVGRATDNERLEAEGQAQETEAHARKAAEHVKDAGKDVRDAFS